MKRYPIDNTLRALETIADEKNIVIEDCEEYVQLCRLLVDYEFGEEYAITMLKENALSMLKKVVEFVTPVWSENVMEFHIRCQTDVR